LIHISFYHLDHQFQHLDLFDQFTIDLDHLVIEYISLMQFELDLLNQYDTR